MYTPSTTVRLSLLSLLLIAPAAGCTLPPGEEGPPEADAPAVSQELITTTTGLLDVRNLELAVNPRTNYVIQTTITSLMPGTVNRGDTLNVRGTNLTGVLINTSVAVRLQAGAQRVDVIPFFTSATELRLVVPSNATTGAVELINRATNAVMATAPAQLVVNLPTTGTLRVTNNSQYNVIQLEVGGQNQLAAGQFIAPGGFRDITRAGGAVSWTATLGFGNNAIFLWTGNSTVVNGQQVNASAPRITAIMALTQGQATARFAGTYWIGTTIHSAEFRFSSNGTFQLWNDGSLLGNGNVVDGAFQSGSSLILFSLAGAQTYSTSFDVPYGSFFLSNGPPDWPTVQYVRQ